MIKVVQKLFVMLEQLDKVRWLPLSVLARRTGLPKPTLCNLLKTLMQLGYVENDGRGSYRLAEKFCRINQEPAVNGRLEELARAQCVGLAGRTRESAVIAVLHENRIAIVAQARTQHTFMVDFSTYRNLSLWHSTSGRILLAFAEPDALRQIIRSYGYPCELWDGIKSDAALEKALFPIRSAQLALMDNPGEGFTAYSVPFFDGEGRFCGTIGMTVPYQRLCGRENFIIEELKKSAAQLQKLNAENHFSAWDWSKARSGGE